MLFVYKSKSILNAFGILSVLKFQQRWFMNCFFIRQVFLFIRDIFVSKWSLWGSTCPCHLARVVEVLRGPLLCRCLLPDMYSTNERELLKLTGFLHLPTAE